MGARTVLVTIENAGATAGVVRDAEWIWLTDALEHGAGTALDDHTPRVIGLSEDRTLQGGLLPARAVTAQVTDDAGVRRPAAAANGAWVIVLDQPCEGHISPVCFRDADGAIVSPELPADWARSAVPDADEPCPACGGRRWDEVRAPDGRRGTHGPDMRPTPFVVCRACGHEHSVGVFHVSIGAEPAPDERARMIDAADAELQRQARAALGELRFDVYAARGWSGRIGGWGTSDDVLSSVTVDHGAPPHEPGPSLCVQTEHEPIAYESEIARARSTLFGALSEELGESPERSDAGLAIWLYADERRRLRRAARAISDDHTLLVDGEPLRFATVAAGERWVAVARHGDLVITVATRAVDADAIELVAVADPLQALIGDPD